MPVSLLGKAEAWQGAEQLQIPNALIPRDLPGHS